MRDYDKPPLGCPKCDSGWIYVNDRVTDSGYHYDQVTACPRCLPQHVTTKQRRDEPPPPESRRDLE